MKAKEFLSLIESRPKRNRAKRFHLDMLKKFHAHFPEIRKMKAARMAEQISKYGKTPITPEMEKYYKSIFKKP